MAQRGTARETTLIRAFVGLADSLVDDYDVIDVLDRLAGHSVDLLRAEAAGILLADEQSTLHVVASTNETTEWMELLQLQSDEGPCVECFTTGMPVSVEDLVTAGRRWPTFVAALGERSRYGSVHALPLRLRGQSIGTLNLFHRTPGSLPEEDLALGQALADVATIGILQERAVRRGEVVSEQLRTALVSRVVIEQAKGLLAERGRVSVDVAFQRLRGYARSHNLRLTDVARQTVEGQLTAEVLAPGAHQPKPNVRRRPAHQA